jgi:DNA-binding MarR family transcriptional regulator
MRPEVRRDIARLIGHTRRLCSMAVNKRLSLLGSSLHEYSVLFRLAEESEVPQHELAFDAGIDPAAVSRLVREMAHSGLVSTRVDPADKRQRFVRITPKGRALEEALTPVVDVAIEPYMVGLSAAEEQQLRDLLHKAHSAIVAMSAQPELAERPQASVVSKAGGASRAGKADGSRVGAPGKVGAASRRPKAARPSIPVAVRAKGPRAESPVARRTRRAK